MEEIDEAETNWLDGFGEEEYVTNSFIDSTAAAPVLVEHKDMQVESGADPPPPPLTCVSVMNKLISAVYSGPTISDIESALSISYRCGGGTDDSRSNYRPSILLPEKGSGKAENKYTLRIKNCGSILADDGYKWRKYGQKSIKNSPNPRSYYRCTNPRCNAKKQVEKSTEDPHMLIVTYEGLHLHYTYSHFLLPKPKDSPSSATDLHMSKKPRTQTNPVAAPQVAEPKKQSRVTAIPDEQKVQQKQQQEQTENTGEGRTQEGFLKDFVTKGPVTVDEDLQHGLMLSDEHSPQGLLEDVVPWLVRKPCSSIVCASPNEQSSSYSDQASSPSNSSSLSWSPNYCYLDAAILSDIITSL